MATVSQWTGRETRLLRKALRLTIRDFAEDLGVSVRTVSKWEAAGAARIPRAELQAALDTLLQRASAEERERFHLAAVPSPLPTGVPSDPVPGSPSTEPGSVAAAVSPAGEIQTAVATAAAQAAAFAVWWETQAVGQVSVDLVFAELRRLSGQYLDGPPEPVVLGVRDVRDLVFDLLRRHQSPGQARDLHLAAGYACALLAWLAGDLGGLAAADTHARAAGLFVATSGSAELGAWVRAVRSKTLFWAGDYRAAADEAAAGLTTAPPTSVRVLLAAQVADAWATLGAPDEARVALAGAVDARQAVRDPDLVGGLLSCSPAREANYLSGIHQRLGSSAQAVTVAQEALSLSQAQLVRSYATEAQIRLNMVDVFLELGDLDAASEALQPVFELSPDRRLHTLTSRVGQLEKTLAQSRFVGNDAVQVLQDRISAFVSEPAGSS